MHAARAELDGARVDHAAVQYLYHYPNASHTESPVLGVKIGSEPCTEMYPALRWYGDSECNEIASSFIGYEVCQTDSLTRFRMTDTDYITIRQHAPLGQKWPAWQWNGETVWGITTEINATSFMGLEDSVKSIYFFTETQNGVQTYLPAPDRPMELSKQHGLIEALWLRDFPDTSAALPIIGLSEPKVGLQNIGRDDVFNLQVGDELHIIEQNTVGAEIGYYNVKKAIHPDRRRAVRADGALRTLAKFRIFLELFPFYRKGMFKRQKSYMKSERMK